MSANRSCTATKLTRHIRSDAKLTKAQLIILGKLASDSQPYSGRISHPREFAINASASLIFLKRDVASACGLASI